ncbi:hypothetical protein DSECCO2_637520 [anaerobic digester metagenome]
MHHQRLQRFFALRQRLLRGGKRLFYLGPRASGLCKLRLYLGNRPLVVANIVFEHRRLRFKRRRQLVVAVDFAALCLNGNHQRAAALQLLGKILLKAGHGAVRRIKVGLRQQQLILKCGRLCTKLG